MTTFNNYVPWRSRYFYTFPLLERFSGFRAEVAGSGPLCALRDSFGCELCSARGQECSAWGLRGAHCRLPVGVRAPCSPLASPTSPVNASDPRRQESKGIERAQNLDYPIDLGFKCDLEQVASAS